MFFQSLVFKEQKVTSLVLEPWTVVVFITFVHVIFSLKPTSSGFGYILLSCLVSDLQKHFHQTRGLRPKQITLVLAAFFPA